MDARAEQIRSLYRQGLSQRTIARQLGLSQPAIRKRLLRLGLLPSRDNPDPDDNHDHGQGDNLPDRGSDNRTPAAPTTLRVRFHNPRPRCLACGGTVKVNRRGFLLTEENQPLGSLCLRCLVNGPQAAGEKMRAYASSLMEVADRLAKLDGEGWNPVGIILRLRPLHPGGPSLPR